MAMGIVPLLDKATEIMTRFIEDHRRAFLGSNQGTGPRLGTG